MSDNTQLTPPAGYDTDRIIFSDPQAGTIPGSVPKIEFRRINISTKNEDGTVGELILPTERLFSFGVSENTNPETGKVNGYTFPLCLYGRDEATAAEKTWVTTFNAIVEKCIDHLIENREEIERFELTRSDLKKAKGGLNPLYWKREKHQTASGKMVLRRVPGSGPTLYTKLIFSKKSEKFLSQFFDMSDNSVDPMTMMGKYCYTQSAVKIESIFIGSRISLQVKLYEAVVEPAQTGMKRLLRHPKRSKVLEMTSNKSIKAVTGELSDSEKSDSDDNGSIAESSSDESSDEPKQQSKSKPKPATKVTKRVVRKIVKRLGSSK